MNGDSYTWQDAADIGTVLPPPELSAPMSSYESTDSGFFGSLFQGIGDVALTAAKSVAAQTGTILTRSIFPTPTQAPMFFGPGAPATVGARSPVGHPSILSFGGGAGGGFIPQQTRPSPGDYGASSALAGFLSNPMHLALGVMGFLVVMMLMRR